MDPFFASRPLAVVARPSSLSPKCPDWLPVQPWRAEFNPLDFLGAAFHLILSRIIMV